MASSSERIELQKEFPLLSPNGDCTVWEGYIATDNPQLKIKVCVPNYPELANFSFSCSPLMKTFLARHIKTLQNCSTVKGLIYSIVHIVKTKSSTLESNDLEWDARTIKSIHSILSELYSVVDKENILMIRESFRDITVTYVDSNATKHMLRFSIPQDYPRSFITILEANLPTEIISAMGKMSSMKELYDSFKQNVESLLPFWSMCRNLEEKAWVIDPPNPQLRDVYRRIMLNSALSIMITFNPLEISSCPEIRFLGCMDAVAEAREKYVRNVESIGWHDELDVAGNISQLLEVYPLPVKTSLSPGSQRKEKDCYICFCSDDDEEPPSKWCSNERCTSWYHYSCLMEWFKTIVSSRLLYDHISGPCPYCDEKMWLPLRNTTDQSSI